MENGSAVQAPTNTKPAPVENYTTDSSYVDPNSKRVKDSGDLINYKPNKKFTIFLFTLFLVTAIAAVVITNNKTKNARESIKSKQLLLPTPTKGK